MADTPYAGRVLVSVGNNGMAAHQIGGNGTAKLKRVLTAWQIGSRSNGEIELENSEEDAAVGYLSLSEHPGRGTRGVVVKQVRLIDLWKDYKGPDLYLDLDQRGHLIGIEIVG